MVQWIIKTIPLDCPIDLFLIPSSSPKLYTVKTKAMVYIILSGIVYVKDPLLLIRVIHEVTTAG